MDRIIHQLHQISRYGVWFGGFLIILAGIVICAEVFGRKFFNVSLGGTDDWSGFALAISSAWAFGFALLERAHVRIDSVYVWLPMKARAVLDIVALVFISIFITFLAYMGTGVFLDSVEMKTMTMSTVTTPLMYPQFLWITGLYLFVVIAFFLIIRSVVSIAKGDFAAVQRQISSKTVSDELDEEKRDIERRQAEVSARHEQ